MEEVESECVVAGKRGRRLVGDCARRRMACVVRAPGRGERGGQAGACVEAWRAYDGTCCFYYLPTTLYSFCHWIQIPGFVAGSSLDPNDRAVWLSIQEIRGETVRKTHASV